jgi:hypothetical protein
MRVYDAARLAAAIAQYNAAITESASVN